MSLRTVNLKHRAFRVRTPAVHSSVFRSYLRRNLSTPSSQSPNAGQRPGQGRGIPVMTVFGALIMFGVGSTAYGLYEFYNTLTLWPQEVRKDLRAGLKARNQGDLGLSERYLRRAYQTALDLPSSMLNPSPYLKLSGIAITLASVLETDNRPRAAWDVYVRALSLPQPSISPSPSSQNDVPASTKPLQPPQEDERQLTPQETLRQVSIAHKLGEMAEMYNFGEDEEEKWLTWAVERLLGIVRESGVALPPGSSAKGTEEQAQEKQVEEARVVLGDLDLPEWVTKTDLGAPLETLGAFYARQGKVEYAMPLYLQAISLLMPNSQGQSSSLEDRCRGAQIMNNLSSLIMSKPPTPSTLSQAELWARKSAAVCGQELHNTKPKKDNKDQLNICERTLAVALFNMASLREMADDREAAKGLFSDSLDQSRRIGMKEGIMEAQAALRRLERADRRSAQKLTPSTN